MQDNRKGDTRLIISNQFNFVDEGYFIIEPTFQLYNVRAQRKNEIRGKEPEFTDCHFACWELPKPRTSFFPLK